MKRLILSFLTIILLFCSTTFCRAKYSDYAKVGGKNVKTSSVTTYSLMETFPLCIVTIYLAGTTTLASIYSNNSGTVKSNPFTSDSKAYYEFYADNGAYDVKFSGTGIISPITRANIILIDTTAVYLNNKTLIINNCNNIDDTAFLNAATLAANTVIIPSGVSCASKAITLYAYSNFVISKGATLKALPQGSNNQLFTIISPTNGTVSLTTALQGSYTIQISSTTGILVGDRVIVSGGTFTGSGSEEGPLDFYTVKSVDSTTQLTLESPLAYSYSAFGLPSAAPKIIRLASNYVHDVRITGGGTLIPDPTFNSIYFNFANVERIEIDHLIMNGAGNGITTGHNVSNLNYHDNYLTGKFVASGSAINFASLVRSNIRYSYFNSTNETLLSPNNHIILEVTCHDNNIDSTELGPIRATSSGAIEIDFYGFNNKIISPTIWGLDQDIIGGNVTLGVRTYAGSSISLPFGNIITGANLSNIMFGIGDDLPNSIINSNIHINKSLHAFSSGIISHSLNANLGVNTFKNITNSTLTPESTIPLSKSCYMSSTVCDFWGNGSPETNIVAGIGSIFHRLDGGASTSVYIKESGTGNTGWVAK